MHARGFTLVELITIIIIVGILAVYATPRFFTADSTELTGAKAELVSMLREQQQRAMQDTSQQNYYGVLLEGSSVAAVLNCTDDPTVIENRRIQLDSAVIESSAGASQLCFNGLGCLGNCGNNNLQLSLQGRPAASWGVCINAEGYIKDSACE
ncbi:prepilin-type N-terminal cleavage/methylation domain-containing protein [Aliidiomarina sp. Khilg15.8]